MQKKQILISSALLVTIGFILLMIFVYRNSSDTTELQSDTAQPQTENDGTAVNSPTSKVDVIEKNETNTPPVPPSDGSSPASVTPFITFAGVVGNSFEVNAYMTILESGGKCTATVTNQSSGSSKSKTVDTLPDASTTQCKLVSFPLSELESGTSAVVVEYTSSKYTGSSEKLEVNIP